jgi:Glycosyl transferase family 8
MPPSLTLFFIVEPPAYLYMGCHLAASIRKFLPPDVTVIGYCPAHRWDEMEREQLEVLRRLRCEVRPINSEGRFDPAYPHGNKILATLEPKDTDFAAFLDSDMLFLKPCSVEELVSAGQVGMVPASSMRWAPQTVWTQIYGTFGMAVPEERMTMTRDKRERVAPYFNAGLIVIDERWRTDKGQRFAEVWMDCAQSLDRTGIESRRPYLDQMTLPVATLAAGMTWNTLPEKYNYSINGILRGKPLAEDADVTLLHYRGRDVLADAGLKDLPDSMMAELLGTSRMRWIFRVPPPAGIPLVGLNEGEAKAPAAPVPAPHVAQGTRPDPSKARMAAVTMVKGDHVFLRRWVDYYGGLIGRENLYVLRHGHDEEIDRIAAGANILHQPDTGDKTGFDRRRWATLSHFTSGLTLYYNWVICSDVDEIVAPDPATGLSLPDYLDALSANGRAPHVISPFAIEIVHTPALEPEPLDPARPILSVRRNFRLNSNYAKPCLTRRRINFSVGGHGCASADVVLDPNLYLFHLRFMDDTLSRARLLSRKAWAEDKTNATPGGTKATNTWLRGTDTFETLSQQVPTEERAEFPEFVKAMRDGRQQAESTGNWFFKTMRSKELYRLPERFSRLF